MKYLQDVYFANLSVTCNQGGYFSISPDRDWSLESDLFDQSKFYFITEGSCTITVEGKEYTGMRGDWFFIPAYKLHGYQNGKQTTFSKFWMHFSIYPNTQELTALGLPIKVKVKDDSPVYKLFEEFARLYASKDLTDKIRVKAIVLQLLAEYVSIANADGVEVVNSQDEKFDELLRYINENLGNSLTVGELSKRYYVHPNHFIRLFRSKTGLTPAKYVKDQRLQAARRLLESTTLSVAEIAERTGEIDVANFSRAFKKHYNLSPAEYRKYFKNI